MMEGCLKMRFDLNINAQSNVSLTSGENGSRSWNNDFQGDPEKMSTLVNDASAQSQFKNFVCAKGQVLPELMHHRLGEAQALGSQIPFSQSNASNSEQNLYQATSYTIKSGDTFQEIALKHGVPKDELAAVNPQIENPDMIYPGQIINLPGGSDIDGITGGMDLYTVKTGDSLQNIAWENEVPLDDLIAANPQIENPDMIYPGQIINLPDGMPTNMTTTQMPAIEPVQNR